MTKSFTSTVLLLLISVLMILGSSNAKIFGKKVNGPAKNTVINDSFWKAKYGDYEISQEGFPFNFVMPAV